MTSNRSAVPCSIAWCLHRCRRDIRCRERLFYELEQEDTTLRRGILVVTDNLHLTDVDVEAMLKMAGRGDRNYAGGELFQPYFERYAGI